MSEEHSQTTSVPVDRYPDPVLQYAIEEGTPVVRGVDDSFQQQFGTVRAGDTVSQTFDTLDITVVDSADLTEILRSGDRFTVKTGSVTESTSTRFLIQTTPPAESDDGYLVFVDLTEQEQGLTAPALDVDHFASVISHDLRNPLDVAKARLRAGRDLDQDEHFERVELAHERMERIIQDVLTLSRGEDVVEPSETVELETVAKTAWENVETNGTTLTVEGSLPTIIADSDRAERLFENLFRNSVEHASATGRGGNATETASEGQVTVGRLEHTGAGFYVEDDGPGIPPEKRDRVFEPGYSSDEHGTGLGLAIVARIADLHEWNIEITDAQETEDSPAGARFEISNVEPASDT